MNTQAAIDLWWAARETHARVKAIYVPTADAVQHPKSFDHWPSFSELRAAFLQGKLPDDCDGFARACQLDLRQRGIEARLLTCLVWVPEGKYWGGHLVCEAGGDPVTGKDGQILCNLLEGIASRAKVADLYGYKFLLVQIGTDWYELVEGGPKRG